MESMSVNFVTNNMSKAESDVKRPETMKSNIWIQTANGSIQEVEKEVALLSPTIDDKFKSGLGSSKNNPILLVPQVRATTLRSVFDYCRFHQVQHSHEERETFDENFIQMDARRLFEIITLASYLKLKPLIRFTCKTIAERIRNNSTEEIWQMLNLDDDFPELEKYERVGHSAHDSKIRRLEKLYNNKKQSVVKELEKMKNIMAGLKAGQREDPRKVDDLVSFINGGESQTSKKKKNRKKRAQKKTSSTIASSSEASSLQTTTEIHDEDPNAFNSANDNGSSADTLNLLGTRDESLRVERYFDDGDMDPALLEKIQRDVMKLAERLNLDYFDLI